MGRLLNLVRASHSLRATQLLNREAMLRVQERRWRSLMRFALATSPFYRKHLAGLDPDRCAYTDIPPITKSQLTANWDEIVPDPRLRMDRLREFLSDRRNRGTL